MVHNRLKTRIYRSLQSAGGHGGSKFRFTYISGSLPFRETEREGLHCKSSQPPRSKCSPPSFGRRWPFRWGRYAANRQVIPISYYPLSSSIVRCFFYSSGTASACSSSTGANADDAAAAASSSSSSYASGPKYGKRMQLLVHQMRA